MANHHHLNFDVVAPQELDRLGVVAPEGGVVERGEAVLVLGVDVGPRPGQDLDGRRLSPALSLQVPLIGLVSAVPVAEERSINAWQFFALFTCKLDM